MAPECHSLLKSVCALKGITVSEFAYEAVEKRFQEMVYSDNQVQQMMINGDYPIGSKAYALQEQLRKDLNL
jgi:hypothetical protein